jgi:hypothetical protein
VKTPPCFNCKASDYRLALKNLMEAIELEIKGESYRIIRNSQDSYAFSVFNYATCHIIKKNDFGIWKAIEHRFGTDNLPIDEIGEAIDKHYTQFNKRAFLNN